MAQGVLSGLGLEAWRMLVFKAMGLEMLALLCACFGGCEAPACRISIVGFKQKEGPGLDNFMLQALG